MNTLVLVLPLQTMLGPVQHYTSCYYDWLTAAFLPSLPALSQTSVAEVMPESQARNLRSAQEYAVKSKFRGLLSGLCNSSINQTAMTFPSHVLQKRIFYILLLCITAYIICKELSGVTFKMSDFGHLCFNPRISFLLFMLHMGCTWPRTEPLPDISKRVLSSEKCWDGSPLLILRMFWYFGLDLRWTTQASGKYQTDCKILALFLKYRIAWACLGASLRALNAFYPAAMPRFPGVELSVKLVSLRK